MSGASFFLPGGFSKNNRSRGRIVLGTGRTTQEGTLVTDDGGPTSSGQRLSTDTVQGLYDIHGRDVLTFLVGVLRNADAAQDVCQITFQRLLEVGHEANPETVRGWLFKVAFNEAMAYRRRQNRDESWQRKQAEFGQESITLDLSLQTLVKTEEIEKLRRLLQQLPAEQQLVVQRRIHDDKTFATIAEELNVPLGTVLTRMRLALEKLQRWLG